MGRSRGGLTTKIHALADGHGLPVRLALTPGQAHGGHGAAVLLNDLPDQAVVLADKAYDADWIRDRIEAQGATPPDGTLIGPLPYSKDGFTISGNNEQVDTVWGNK